MKEEIQAFSPDQLRTACFSGHRFLPADKLPVIEESIRHSILTAYEAGYRVFLCGCAIGFDTLAALQILRLKKEYPDIALHLVIPCENQSDKWSAGQKSTYLYLQKSADHTDTLSKMYYPGCMQVRNRFMVDRSSLCICYLNQVKGGTASTVRYALNRRLKIINLFDDSVIDSSMMRESNWNYTYTYRSASGNARTAPLFHTRGFRAKHRPISEKSSLKQH